jgi:multiple sugar transport system substrate-binding protein
MKKGRKTTLWVVGLVLVLLLTPSLAMAEGQKEQAPEEGQEQAEPEEKTVYIAYNEYFTKTFGPADPPIDVIQQHVSEKYPHINVKLQTTPLQAGAWHDTYVTWFMSEDSKVDIYGVGAYWTAEFAEAGWIVPLGDKVDQDLLNQLNDTYLDAHSYNGKLYGLGPWWGGIGGLYYRKDLLNEYGFDPPETYNDVVEIVETIKEDRPEMTGWTWPAMNDTVLVNRWTEFLHGFGGQYFHDDGSSAVNSDDAVEALTYMRNLIEDGISPKEITTWKEEDAQTRFVNGNAIFHSGRQDMMFWLDDPEQSKVVDKWGFIQNPAQPDGDHAGFYEGWAFSISKFTDVPDAALKVLEVMFSFPVQKKFNLSQGPLQAHEDVYTDEEVLENNPNMELIEKVADSAVPPIPSPNYVEISDVLKRQIHSVLTGQMEPRPALEEAAQKINGITGSN